MTTNLNQQSHPLALIGKHSDAILKLYHSCSPWNHDFSSASEKFAPPRTIPLSSASNKSTPPRAMPLSSTSNKSLPFVINGKGIFPSRAAPPDRLSSYDVSSCKSKTYNISIQKKFIFGVDITPSIWRRYSKASCRSGFVKYVFHLFFCAHILNSDVLFCNLFL
jgi:hypothetical protein